MEGKTMGYSYTLDGKLCCDVCGNSGDTRKYKCPYNWCQSIAMCTDCRKEHGYHKKEHHTGCKQSSIEFHKREAKRKELIENGFFVRCSALGKDNGFIHVLFQGKTETVGRYMTDKTYHAIPLLTNATIEDYEVIEGHRLVDAPASFY